MKILIAVSGTGGHIYPALVLGKKIKDEGDEVVFVGVSNKLTQNLIRDNGFEFFSLPIEGWQGRRLISLLFTMLTFVSSFFKSLFIIRKTRPDVVVGMGGYVTVPIVTAAYILRIDRIIHEQNAYPGLANRLSAILSTKIALGFEKAKKYFNDDKVVVTGNPLRDEFYHPGTELDRDFFNIPKDNKIVLVFGGSQGARKINEFLKDVISNNTISIKNITFIHITGEKYFKEYEKDYKVFKVDVRVYPYLKDLYRVFRIADCVISRAGALTCSEIIVSGVPSILIPYPYATDDHQMKNARFVEELGIAKVYKEQDIDSAKLAKDLEEMLLDKDLKFKAQEIAREYKKNRPEEIIYKIIKNS